MSAMFAMPQTIGTANISSGLRVSPLALGTMTFGTTWGWGADERASRRMFDAYLAAGGNFIDTADLYTGGESEQLLHGFSPFG